MGIDFTAEAYIDAVLSGEVVACRWVRLACERHRRDLVEGGERGLWFDRRAAMMAVAFFGVLRHSKGEWARQPIQLEPWQQAHLWMVFGWKRADGTRRFRTSYMEVARKNGKSTMAAGVGLYLLVADGEPGAEIFTAGTKLKQARIIHQEAIRMVKQSPALQRELVLFKDNINSPKTFSKFEPLGADSETEDGLNVHGALIDELHAHPNGDMWDVLETATGSRRQPLIYAITTAGNNRETVCYQMHDYTRKVLEGTIVDDSHYGIIYSLDRVQKQGDELGVGDIEDWRNEDSWIKANPNLHVSKKLDNMQDKATKAAEIPGRLNAFLQKELNVWVSGESQWLLPEQWDKCRIRDVMEDDLRGRRCWMGLDLSKNTDITAAVYVFEPDDEGIVDVACRFWLPSDGIQEKAKKDMVPYLAWVDMGYLELTPGDVIDHDWILAQVRKDVTFFDVQEGVFDPWNASHVSSKLIEDGLDMFEFRQGPFSYNPAINAIEVAIKRRLLNHGGHPILSWMVSNVVMYEDSNGNRKPLKDKNRKKIDGAVAMIMAYDRLARNMGEQVSTYEEKELLVL